MLNPIQVLKLTFLAAISFAIAGCAGSAANHPSTLANTQPAPQAADATAPRASAQTEPAQLNPATGSAQTNVSTSPIEVPPIKNKSAQPAPKIDKSRFPRAASLSSPTWINSSPLMLEQLQGKVVVVEFWTFACYNCKNTLPFVKDWYSKYRDQGLVVIGVHTPELSFEKDVNNVKQAVRDYQIEYPIAIDGDFANWNRYSVWAWPTWFIIDKEGYIRYSHVGEGDYNGSEATIQKLLAE